MKSSALLLLLPRFGATLRLWRATRKLPVPFADNALTAQKRPRFGVAMTAIAQGGHFRSPGAGCLLCLATLIHAANSSLTKAHPYGLPPRIC